MNSFKQIKNQSSIENQGGQAMVETVVVLVVVAGLWVGVSWIGKIQDLALNSVNISSYAAFATSLNQSHDAILANSKTLLNKQAYQWRNHDGSLVLKDSYGDLAIDWQRNDFSPNSIQIGMNNTHAKHLRNEWLSADTGILSVHSSLNPIAAAPNSNPSDTNDSNNDSSAGGGSNNNDSDELEKYKQFDAKHLPESKSKLGLEFFLQNFPKISRHTSIATGAAYSTSDKDTAKHIQKSKYGWLSAVDNSQKLGKKIDGVASDVDGGWSRSRPNFDWLHPWEKLIPNHIKN